MKLHSSKRLAAWAFVLMAIVSSVNLVLAARNYTLLYAALNQLQFTLPQISLQNAGQNANRIVMQVVAENPVDYNGLTIALVYISTYFGSSGSYVFRDRPLQSGWTVGEFLLPRSSTSFNFTIMLNQQNATSLSSFYASHPAGVTADAYLVVGVSSFLYSLTGRLSYYSAPENLTLTAQ